MREEIMDKELPPGCALCNVQVRICQSKEGTGPKFCPTKTKEKENRKTLEKYSDPETMRFARASSLQEAECYVRRDEKPFVMRPTKTRVEEIIEFAQKMNYRKLGVAFCAGLFSEGRTFVEILEKHGFEVVSVCCKVGGVPKEFLGLSDDEKVRVGRYETMCNPITQAELLNEAGTDFNVLVGLCVGHDALFLKNAKALTTVLVAKDRVLGHNPVAALYGVNIYFQRLMNP
jgi:uncharacterized metal-binding protein